jgi:hypothetical protein
MWGRSSREAGIPRGVLIALVLGSLWIFPSCGGDDNGGGGDDASDSPSEGIHKDVVTDNPVNDAPMSNAVDSAAE